VGGEILLLIGLQLVEAGNAFFHGFGIERLGGHGGSSGVRFFRFAPLFSASGGLSRRPARLQSCLLRKNKLEPFATPVAKVALMHRLVLIVTMLCTLLAPDRASSQDPNPVSADNEFVVYRDFSPIQVSKEQAASMRAFLDFGVPGANSVANLDEIRTIAVRLLAGRVTLVPQKSDGNLLIQVRMYQTKNYAIRNPKREPAHGLILAGACKYPIIQMATDCGSLTYYYFADYRDGDIFETVFKMWINATFPQ
jgi:hypothetical protein